MEINRDLYLNRLKRARHNGMIKIVTGLRRSGKSYLLFKLFYDYLLQERFEDIVRIMASSIGSLCNPGKLSNTFKSVTHEDLHFSTIHTFLNNLKDAFFIEKATKYSPPI